MTILITGATGTVGKHIVQQLVQQGSEVRAISRNPQQAKVPEGVQAVAGNLNDPESLIPALQGVTAMHLIISSDEAYGSLQTDPRIIELAEEAGIKRVTVLVGYEEGPVEAALRESQMEWTLLKPGEFMANILVDWQESIRTEGVVREPFGHALSARIHEADIARVAVAALLEVGHHGQEYFLTGPEALSRTEAVRIISEVTGKDIRFVELTEEQARDQWRAQGYDEESIEFFVQMGKNPPEIGYTVLPTVEEVTGRPAATLADWVRDHLDDF
ncbi:NAD(P)H azoreductase [Paenibacillus sp. GM2FR]|uniref:NAD(P)H-binding protein n=1 Tax=Paenibacillus TaxID=44249 RepID=UPI000C27A129|nr:MULTISPECIES: NAD(P)H-binding protein [Paenibacillus]MEC0258265.1 NAD(P)H-binding protein [Paenibacillus lautus]PJN56734.1 NAD(P)H azoreductase [Paenibacillus sp. GM2FR]